MPDQRDQQKQQGGQGGQQQKDDQQRQQPMLKTVEGGKQQGGGGRTATDQLSFYDETLKKEIEGSFTSDGKSIHVSSIYGTKSVPYSDLGACIDYSAQVSLVRNLLSDLARDPGSGQFKDLQQQKGDQEPMHESNSSWGCGSGSGANP